MGLHSLLHFYDTPLQRGRESNNAILISSDGGRSLVGSPYLYPLAQVGRERGLDQAKEVGRLVPAGHVCDDDQLVLKSLRPIDKVLQMQVAELMDPFSHVLGAGEAHFRD